MEAIRNVTIVVHSIDRTMLRSPAIGMFANVAVHFPPLDFENFSDASRSSTISFGGESRKKQFRKYNARVRLEKYSHAAGIFNFYTQPHRDIRRERSFIECVALARESPRKIADASWSREFCLRECCAINIIRFTGTS